MKFRPLFLWQRNLEEHVTKLGYDYAQLVKGFEHDTPHTKLRLKMKQKSGRMPDLHTIADWKKEWLRDESDKAVDNLEDV